MSAQDTLVGICAYEGDADLVHRALPVHARTGFPIVILSPEDSRVVIPPYLCHHAGKRAYIGAESLHRQLRYFEILLSYPHEFFLIHDADSIWLADYIPQVLHDDAGNVFWSNELVDPRTHPTNLPRIAMQPPYFASRHTIWRMLNAAKNVTMCPIEPYVDHFAVQLCYAAGLRHRPFTDLEHWTKELFTGSDPWEQLAFRIAHMGTIACHPIKTQEQLDLCIRARAEHEGAVA